MAIESVVTAGAGRGTEPSVVRRIHGQASPSGFGEMVASLWRNRALTRQMIRREVVARYRGSVLGLAWSFLNPLLLLSVYTFVFGYVFRARTGTGAANMPEYAMRLFAGLIVFRFFADCLSQAPRLVLGRANFVKRVVFPLEILSWVDVGAALFHAATSTAILVLGCAVIRHAVPWTLLLVPAALFPLALMTLGFSWFLSSLGVYVRDITHVVNLLTMVLMFLSPVFYETSVLPSWMQPFFYVNPLTVPIELFRSVVLGGAHLAQAEAWALYLLASLAVAWAGFACFQKARGGFADVL